MLLKEQSKRMVVLLIFTVLSLIIFQGGVTNNFDYESFKWNYEGLVNSSFEPGYLLLENFSRAIGLSYNLFRLILASFSMLLISITIKKYTYGKYAVLFLLIHLLITIPFFAYSLRSALAFSIVIFAYPKLVNGRIKDIGLYILLNIVAMQFHISSAIFLILIFIPIFDKIDPNVKFLSLFMFFSIIFIISISDFMIKFLIDGLFEYILIPLGISESKIVYSLIVVRYGFILFALSHFSFVFILRFIYHHKNNDLSAKTENRLVRYTLYASYIMTIIIPLLRITTEYSRLIRGFIPIYYLAIISEYPKLNRNARLLVVLFTLGATIINLFIYVLPYLDETFFPLFRDNWLF